MSEFDPTASITEQAAHWCILLNGGSATRADKRAFGEWVSRSPERVEAYIQAARLTKALKSKKVRWPDTPIEVLIREAKEGPADVVPLFSSDLTRANSKLPRNHLKSPFVLTVAATVIIGLVGTWVILGGPQRYMTALGEQRSVVLNDGSVVTLNTSSTIEVKLEKTHRTIKLVAGEALFQVAHDKSRPFDVISGDTTVRAVGTQFNVDQRSTGTTVTVVEGKVTVGSAAPVSGDASGVFSNAPVQPLLARKTPDASLDTDIVLLSAGEQVTVSPRAHLLATAANVAAATAWTQRRLVFEHRPLGEVADEFNRYNRRKIRIRGPKLKTQEVTGVFQANDPNSFLDFVAKIPGVRIEQAVDATDVVISD